MNETKVETKEELIQNIKEWIKIDNEIHKLNKELKELKLKQKLFTKNLVNVMKTNQLECFDINGGRIMYKKNKLKKPINTKMLLQTLKNYYTDNPTIADEVTEYILSNREEVIKETIKRKIDK
jgi:hypothetical protein